MLRCSRTSGLMRCSASSCSRNSSTENSAARMSVWRLTAAKSLAASCYSFDIICCALDVSKSAFPFKTSVTNMRSNCPRAPCSGQRRRRLSIVPAPPANTRLSNASNPLDRVGTGTGSADCTFSVALASAALLPRPVFRLATGSTLS